MSMSLRCVDCGVKIKSQSMFCHVCGSKDHHLIEDNDPFSYKNTDRSTDISTGTDDFYGRVIGRKSWFVYFKLIVVFGIIFFFVTSINLNHPHIYYGVKFTERAIVYVLFFATFVYKMAWIRSYVITMYENEVRADWGVFPWERSTSFVQWKNITSITYYPTFTSWITNSYSICITHKNNNDSDSDVVLSNIWNGRKVAGIINSEYEDCLNSSTRIQTY